MGLHAGLHFLLLLCGSCSFSIPKGQAERTRGLCPLDKEADRRQAERTGGEWENLEEAGKQHTIAFYVVPVFSHSLGHRLWFAKLVPQAKGVAKQSRSCWGKLLLAE